MEKLGLIKENWDVSDESDMVVDTDTKVPPPHSVSSRATPNLGQMQIEAERGRPPVRPENNDDGF